MKKLILLFVLVLGNVVSFAQGSAVEGAVAKAFWDRVHVGIKAGVTATNVNIDVRNMDYKDYDMPTAEKINWRLGIDTKIDAFDDFFIKTGLEYANKGFNVDLEGIKKKYDDIKSIKGDWSVLYKYIEMPINFGYDFGGLEVVAGPYLSYALGGVENINIEGVMSDNSTFNFDEVSDLHTVNGSSVDEALSADLTGIVPDFFKSFDYGINVGIGFNINKINVQVQYEQGLNNITPDFTGETNFEPNDIQLKHNVLSVNMSYWIK